MVPWRRVIGIIVTFHVVCFGWIMFRAQDMHSVTLITSQIFNHFNAALIPQVVSGYGTIFGLMAVGFLLHLLPEAAETWEKRVVTAAPVLAQAVIITVLIWGNHADQIVRNPTVHLLPILGFPHRMFDRNGF